MTAFLHINILDRIVCVYTRFLGTTIAAIVTVAGSHDHVVFRTAMTAPPLERLSTDHLEPHPAPPGGRTQNLRKRVLQTKRLTNQSASLRNGGFPLVGGLERPLYYRSHIPAIE